MSTTNLDSFDLKGAAKGGLIREDVMDKIWDISKIPLPFTDLAGTDKAKNPYKEWTIDSLATPDLDNAVIDGADASGNNAAVGTRVGNHCQISRKVIQLSTRANAVDSIGDIGKLAYQVMKRQQELRRDVEAISLTNQASVVGTSSAVSKAGGLGSWLKTNTSRGAGGADGGFNTSTGLTVAPTIGTGRALSEKMVRDVAEKIHQEGGDPTVIMSTPKVIRGFGEYLFSSSARVATMSNEVSGSKSGSVKAIGTVNIFVSDFATLELVDNRLQQLYPDGESPENDLANLYIIDPKHVAFAYLTGYQTEPLAKTGLSDRRQVTVDWTLVVHNEKAHGVVADILPASSVVAGY